MNENTKQQRANRPRLLSAGTVIGAAVLFGPAGARAATTGFNQDAAGPWDYNTPSNWVSDINGVWHSSLTLSAAQAVTFGADTTLSASSGVSLNLQYAGNFALTLRADGTGNRTLTLGGDVVMNTATTSVNPTINLGSSAGNQNLHISLGAQTRSFHIFGNGNRNITVRNGISGTAASAGINKLGAGTLTLDSTVSSYSGDTNVYGGNFVLQGRATAANSAFVINAGAILSINNGGGNTAGGVLVRGKSLTFNSGTLTFNTGSSTAVNYDDQFADGIAVNGSASINLLGVSTKYHRLTTASFTQAASASTFFRGLNLGVHDSASQVVGSTNIVFTAAPTLSGSGAAGTSTVGIIAGAYGDTGTGGTNTGTGLVTYDAAKGVRLLAANEYTATFAHGQGNVSLTGVEGGVSGAPATHTLNGTATVQSLSLNATGATGNSGLIVAGTGALSVSSGTIFARQAVTGTVQAGDAIVIAKDLDFGAVEGRILVGGTTGIASSGSSPPQGQTLAPVEISGVIAGSAGLTKAGAGNLHLTGTSANTYSGVFTLNSGNVLLAKTGVDAITGDIVVNGGNLIQLSNQIADSANVTVNGGAMRIGNSTNGNSASNETFASLTVNGGAFVGGPANQVSTGTLIITGAVVVNGGAYNQTGGYTQNIGSLTMNGGTSVINATSAGGTGKTVLTIDGDLVITNTASAVASNTGGEHAVITLNAGGTGSTGARLRLLGGLVFNGNATNSNTTMINGVVGATVERIGNIDLNDSASAVTRTWTINDGAAADDLTVSAIVLNSGGGAARLIKAGQGTLHMTAVNTYAGGTSVQGGVLAVSGMLGSGDVLVANGAVLRLNALGTIDDNAAFTLNEGAQAELSFTGVETVGFLTLGGMVFTSGTFDANTPGGYFSGGGSIVATPEPASLSLAGLACIGLMQRRRTKRPRN